MEGLWGDKWRAPSPRRQTLLHGGRGLTPDRQALGVGIADGLHR